MNDNATGFMFAARTYDFLKKLVQVVLPALSSLYFGLAAIWGLPAAEQVVGTLAVLTTFLGVCLGISSNNYQNSDAAFDGKLVVTEHLNDSKMTYSLELSDDSETLAAKKELRFKVDDRLE